MSNQDPQNELEWDDFGVPWTSTTCMELNIQVDILDSNLLSIEVRFLFSYLQLIEA